MNPSPKSRLPMPILAIVVCVMGLAAVAVWFVRAQAPKQHDPIEYYRGWGGYSHPIVLQHKITKEEADALAAKGNVYLIGYYDPDGRLARAIKILRGSVFFDFEYTYHPNGKRKRAKITNADGVVTLREYDQSGRGLPGNPSSFW